MSDREALYLTDPERALVSPGKRRRYRYRLTFRLRQTYYTRWFKSAVDLSDYKHAHAPDLVAVSESEDL